MRTPRDPRPPDPSKGRGTVPPGGPPNSGARPGYGRVPGTGSAPGRGRRPVPAPRKPR